MGNKKKRNKLCECGSGKLFRDCHMKGAVANKYSQSIPQQRIEHQIDTTEAKAMSEMMRTFEEKQQQEHKLGDEVLTKLISREIKPENAFSVLIALGAVSLLPENQTMEQRLLQLGQKIVGSSSPAPVHSVDLKKVLKTFDKHFGPSHEMAEIDTKEQIYISRVKFNGQHYRIFTGTLAEGEVYLQDIIWKYEAVRESLPKNLGFVNDLLEWAFKSLDNFIEESGLVKHESSKGADYPNKNIYTDKRVNDIASHLSSSFIFPKVELPKVIQDGLSNIARSNQSFTNGGMTDFYKTPVVDYESHYVIAFPQLLITSILKWVFDQVPNLKTKQIVKDKFEDNARKRLGGVLKSFFGEGKVLEGLTLNGKVWANFCVKYDGKLLFISLVTSIAGENLSNLANENLKHMFKLYEQYKKDKTLPISASNGQPKGFSEILDIFEPVMLTVVEHLDEDLMFGIGDIQEKTLYDVIPLGSLEYILTHSSSRLDFIRYLRAIDDLRNRNIIMPGATPIDLYAMYKDGNHQLREAEQDPNMLLIDLTSGARKITEDTRQDRRSTNLVSIEGKKLLMHKHWDHFYGYVSSGYMYLHRIDVIPSIKFSVPLSSKGVPDELRHSIYIVFDSLCYFLDQNYEAVTKVLPTAIKSIHLTLERVEGQKEPIKIHSETDDQGNAEVTVAVSEKAHEVFAGDDNSGERNVIKLFADALGIANSQKWLDEVFPRSSERNFQSNTYSLSHKAYENPPHNTRIEEGDRWWVDEVLSKAILADGIKPGSYTDPKQIGELATKIASIAKQKLLERLAKYPRQEIIERSYKELEAIYAWDERNDYETLASIAIRDHDETIEKHTQHNQDSTQLSFAYRYLIEASLQSEKEGVELLTDEAYLEVLALAERYVDVEFWGDTTYLDLQPGRLYISKRGFPGIESTGNGRLLARKRSAASLKSAKHKAELRKKIMEEGVPKPGVNEKKMYSKLNKPFKDEFGYTLEQYIDTGKAMIDLFSGLDSPVVMIPKKVLRDKLSSASGVDKSITEKIIERLTLSHAVLKGVDINPSLRFWREERLINKPLIALPLNENILLLTRGVTERMLLSFLDRLMSGRLDYLRNNQQSELNKAVMYMVNQDAHAFEDVVCDAAEDKGLTVRRRCHSVGGVGIPRVGVGEIDGLGWDAKKKTVYVMEIKDNDPARSPVEIKSEMDNFYGRDKKKGYYKQLEDKFDWIKEHQELVRKEFSIDEKTKIKVKPVLVSNAIVASSILKGAPFPTFTLDDFIETL